MDIEAKDNLAKYGDMSKMACATRLIAARNYAGLSQTDLANASGVGKNSLNNMERARQFPNHKVMKYLYRSHGIDFNFLMHGDFNQFSAEVQVELFAHLRDAAPQLDP